MRALMAQIRMRACEIPELAGAPWSDHAVAVGHGSGAQAAALALLGDQDSPVVQAACLLDPVDGLPSRPRQAVRDVQDALSNPAVLGSADEKRALRAALEAIAQGLPEEEEEGSGSPVLPLLAASRPPLAIVGGERSPLWNPSGRNWRDFADAAGPGSRVLELQAGHGHFAKPDSPVLELAIRYACAPFIFTPNDSVIEATVPVMLGWFEERLRPPFTLGASGMDDAYRDLRCGPMRVTYRVTPEE